MFFVGSADILQMWSEVKKQEKMQWFSIYSIVMETTALPAPMTRTEPDTKSTSKEVRQGSDHLQSAALANVPSFQQSSLLQQLIGKTMVTYSSHSQVKGVKQCHYPYRVE